MPLPQLVVFETIASLLLAAVSLFALVKGASYLVDGASDTAKWLKVSPMLVGLTIVAFGTSLPELMVSFFGALSGNNDLSLGNIIGSNIFNIAFILGISALVAKLTVTSRTVMYEFPFLLVSSFILLILGSDIFIFNKSTYSLGRIDGLIFLLTFSFFLYYIFISMRHDQKEAAKKTEKEKTVNQNPLWKNSLLIIGGLLALVIGGKLFVTAAQDIIAVFGVSELFIGVTIAAIGTSLPELATSVVAARKNESDIAIGNIVGSNIFNILFILGVVSLAKPIPVSTITLGIDGMVMIFVTLLFLVFATRNGYIHKKEGFFLLAAYLLYFAYVLWRL